MSRQKTRGYAAYPDDTQIYEYDYALACWSGMPEE